MDRNKFCIRRLENIGLSRAPLHLDPHSDIIQSPRLHRTVRPFTPNDSQVSHTSRNVYGFGQIEHMGMVSAIVPLDHTESGGGGWSITISDAAPVLSDCHIGDSICCNGACLTVTEFTSDSFKVGVAPETLDRTNLGDLKIGAKINLERAMAPHTRFGGHMVQGHVDDTVTIISRERDANSLRLQFRVPEVTPMRPSILPYLIEKGFVTLDGASLTITTVNDSERTFGVMLIAHTQTKIALANKAEGGRVNVEVDMVGKYVEKAVTAALGGRGSNGLQAQIEKVVEKVLAKRQT